ncbi:MAG: hypothetical protein OJF61_002762 [Rhodanobacteraceae bacterium]|nr:MAG: hypothetical protein OJF61_002762 [Rhodanobacteraceae bacterium]
MTSKIPIPKRHRSAAVYAFSRRARASNPASAANELRV